MRKSRGILLPLLVIYAALATLVAFGTTIENELMPESRPLWGVTFVPSYAEYLKTDPHQALAALLDDLKVRHFRLTVQWDETEEPRGQFNFSEIGWQLDELGRRGADAIVAIGRRTPRWPECHDPDWLQGMSLTDQDAATLELLKNEVLALKGRKEIVAWQVENEPFLSVFGHCPGQLSPAFFGKEVALVRSLDPSRPVITTDSGELSTWLRTAPWVDGLGISIYHETWNSWFGKIVYPLPPAFYRRRAEFTKALLGKDVFVSELQAEPWTKSALPTEPLTEQLDELDPAKLKSYVQFAEDTGLPAFYLWGAEWWYSLKVHGSPELWETLRPTFASSR